MNEFSYNVNNFYASNGICQALIKMTENYKDICFVFIGTDCNLGDSLGPLAGTILNIKNGNIFTYGSLKNTITAREVPVISQFIKKAHPDSFIVVIDAAVGKQEDIGIIKIRDEGIKPGLGVNKNLPFMGDGAIIGVISEKNMFNNGKIGLSRLKDVHKMAEVIALGIEMFINIRFKAENGANFLK